MGNNLQQWLWMGGYWPYVWSSYGVVLVLLSLHSLKLLVKHKQLKQRLYAWVKRV